MSTSCQFIFIVLILCGNFTDGTRFTTKLDGVHLKVAVTQNPPWDLIIRGPNGSIVYTGTTRETIDWLSTKLHFTFTFVFASEEEDRKFGAKNAGLNLVIRNEVDLTAFSNSNTPDRRKLMDFSRFISWEDEYRMITPKPGEKDRLFSFVRPFDPMVWLILGISVIVTIYVMSVSKIYIASKSSESNNTKSSRGELLVSYSMFLINTLTNHGDFLFNEISIASFAIVTLFWLLGASVLVYGYSCIIVSSLTAPSMKPSMNTYEDLLENSDVRLLLISDFSWSQSILRGDTEIYRKLAEKAKKHSESITPSIETRDNLLLTGRYVYVHLDTFCRSFIANLYKKEKKCRFEMSDPLRQPSYPYYFMAFVKNSPYNDAISMGLIQLYEAGFIRYWAYSPMPKAEACFNKNQRTNQQSRTLNLDDFAGAFLILGIGLALSMIALVSEFLFFTVKRRATTRRVVGGPHHTALTAE